MFELKTVIINKKLILFCSSGKLDPALILLDLLITKTKSNVHFLLTLQH